MSFRAGILTSGAIGALTGVVLVAGMIAVLALPADAQQPAAGVTGEFQRPYGFGYGEEAQPFDANTRDANGNRLILDGRIMSGLDQSTLSTATASGAAWASASASGLAGATSQAGTGAAIGNQLNVITQGNWNTVIVNSTQTNTGNQTVLNGKLNLQ